jgi:hypothetical protein
MSTINATTTAAPPVLGARPGLPWSTVLPLAVVLSYADGFWMTSFRAATGAIERTQEPFTTWVRESTLALPVFVFAVLGSLALALRLFGRPGRPPRARAAALMVVAGATLAGIGELVVSSAYDYHLQSAGMALMDSMRHGTVASVLAEQQHASLALQVRSVGYASVALLVTNLVLVGWVVAARGGRLNLSAPRARPAPDPTRPEVLRVLLGAALAASAVIHAAVVGEHLSQWPAAGIFFIALAGAELVAAALLVLAGPRPAILLGAVAISIGPLVLWAYSRTLGIPFGPGAGTPEPIGLPDLAAFVLETATLLAAATLLANREWLHRPPVPAHLRALLLTALIAVTTIGLAGSTLPWLNDFPNTTNQTSHNHQLTQPTTTS